MRAAMTPELVIAALMLAGSFLLWAGAMVWAMSRYVATQGQSSAAISELAGAVHDLKDAMAETAKVNAVQDTRLDTHEKRLDGHDQILRRAG